MDRFTQRRRLVVEPKVQMALARRAAWQWILFLMLGFGLLFAWESLVIGVSLPLSVAAEQIWARYSPALAVLVLLLPILIYDALRFSNRFAGPVYRLRRAMRELAQGENVQPLSLRKRDFLKEMAEEFNRLLKPEESSRLAGNPDHEAPAQRSARTEQQSIGSASV